MIEIIEGLAEATKTKEVAEVASDVAKTTELSTGEIGYIRECVSPLDVEALTTRIESVLDCSLAQAMENYPQIAEMLEPIQDQLPAELLPQSAPIEQGEALANVDTIKEVLSERSTFFADDSKWEVEQINDDTYVLEYSGSSTKAIINGDTIICNAGSTMENGQMNEVLNAVLPNKTYVVDGCSVYKTDDLGRVTEVVSDRSKLYEDGCYRNAQRNSDIQAEVRAKGIEGDDGGHLISANSNGANEGLNQVPMNAEMQRSGGEYREFEKIEEGALQENKMVISSRKLYYEGNSERPYQIECTAIIEGVKFTKMIKQ